MHRVFLALLMAASLVAAAWADEAAQPAAERGPVTNLPLPRYVSIKAAEANVRRGPSLGHRIDWVFQRRHMPVEVTAEYGHWRRVRDVEGAGGWVHYSLLSGARYVLVVQTETMLRRNPGPEARVVAQAEPGVVARLGECATDWCQITADGHSGWVEKAALWGVLPTEIRE